LPHGGEVSGLRAKFPALPENVNPLTFAANCSTDTAGDKARFHITTTKVLSKFTVIIQTDNTPYRTNFVTFPFLNPCILP
jgi:hypothetical protein